MEFYNAGSGINIHFRIVNILYFPFSNFTKRELKLMLFWNRFGKFNSRLVKLVRERIVNLQSGIEYLFQIRDCNFF